MSEYKSCTFCKFNDNYHCNLHNAETCGAVMCDHYSKNDEYWKI